MALALLPVEGRKPHNGNCVADLCVTVHADVSDFNSARTSCKEQGGHLITVRSMLVNTVISDLISGHSGDFWIGLRDDSESCLGSDVGLKGYSWITGDNLTDFTNWKDEPRVCSQRCVALSGADPKWTGRHCDDRIAGYLCGHDIREEKCKPLAVESPVLYETPFGFTSEKLQEVPNSSNATQKLSGSKHICYSGAWITAPWSCEVYKGGCEHNCTRVEDTYVCTCFPGYRLESNAVGCSRALGGVDPCQKADCSHECIMSGEKYICQCREGFRLEQDGKSCTEIDHCTGACPDKNSYCLNSPRGFECLCKEGFRKEKDVCEDDDECFSGPCEHMCNNTVGSYHCECSEGFIVSPENTHQCLLFCPVFDCPAVACDLNKPDQCYCPEGFILEERPDGNFCTDIDECMASLCDHSCDNVPGGYICFCRPGFRLVGKTKCVPIDLLGTTVPSTTEAPPVETTSSISAGALLGIIVCTVFLVLLMVCLIHHNRKRCGKISMAKDAHALEQATAETYVKKTSVGSLHYN
ncbi:hypothetical protein HF521_008048 [Silurus meridionalis]|uniref:Thrombomodulin n=2 Tax=Silurus meridionalis TaxID=175797 RepID=A0A8T0AQW5_SILME|nr:hypothetical protein HF521_008048 [Silurus meridionalis]